jgi:hypothetical protein
MDAILEKAEDFPLSETVEWKGDEIPVLSILPDVPGAAEIRDRYFTYKPEITVHRLYKVDVPGVSPADSTAASARAEAGANAGANATADAQAQGQGSNDGGPMEAGSNEAGGAPKEVLHIFLNILCDTDSQTGYTYHSSRRDKDIELIEKSYRVNEKGRRIEDLSFPAEGPLPETVEFRQYIKEANFGGAEFLQKIKLGANYISYTSTNLERLWYGIVPLIGSEGIRNEYLAFRYRGQWYLYMASQVKEMPTINKILGEPVHIPSFYGKRMDVAKEWLTDQLHTRLSEK